MTEIYQPKYTHTPPITKYSELVKRALEGDEEARRELGWAIDVEDEG